MNRIILIGNGFDLAHGLKTSYRDFIDWFWDKEIQALRKVNSCGLYEDNILKIPNLRSIVFSKELDKQTLLDVIKSANKTICKNKLLENITNKLSLQNWVDVETEYYNQLLEIKNGKSYESIEKLNSDFELIKQELEKYLQEITKGTLYQESKINDLIYTKFKYKDFTKSGKNELIEELYNDFKKRCEDEDEKACKLYTDIQEELNEGQIENDKQYFEKEINKMNLFPPRNTLFLNFNYTDTSSKYMFQNQGNEKKQTIHIHGELNNPKNPMIFGYGDELAEEYYQIEKLNDNEYLKNVKSINYLKTNNYRRLLDFINSDCYQIFIFGHSCGNSDRTLLNTLFEHENCVSIKPFYYQEDDGSDNYEEIVMNISRNFKDKPAFRAKVVDKTHCNTLPQKQNAQ